MTWLHHLPLMAKYFLHTIAANLDSFQSMPLVQLQKLQWLRSYVPFR